MKIHQQGEVAHRLGKTLRTVDNWMARGLLPISRSAERVVQMVDVETHLAQTCGLRH